MCIFAAIFLKMTIFKRISVVFLLSTLSVAVFCLSSCKKSSVPRPYGYYRIATPPHTYHPVSVAGAHFDLSDYATVQMKKSQITNHKSQITNQLFDIHYPTLNADIHCSYFPVQGNLRELSDDAMEFIYKHVQQVSSIPEQIYQNDEKRVYGVFFHLEGNAASPYQFFMTDSTAHFLRGAAYCYCRPNADSLAPVHDFLSAEIQHLIESLSWK